MYIISFLRKALTLLAIIFCLTLISTNSAWTGSDGVVEDKDTIEDRGPGNLDTPTEVAPKADQAPEAAKKSTEKPAESAEKKADEKAPQAPPAK